MSFFTLPLIKIMFSKQIHVGISKTTSDRSSHAPKSYRATVRPQPLETMNSRDPHPSSPCIQKMIILCYSQKDGEKNYPPLDDFF